MKPSLLAILLCLTLATFVRAQEPLEGFGRDMTGNGRMCRSS